MKVNNETNSKTNTLVSSNTATSVASGGLGGYGGLASRLAMAVRGQRGQTTAEYALVLLAAATIAMLVVAWAQNTSAIGDFFDRIFSEITSLI